MVWAIVIAVILHIFAYLIYRMAGDVLEEKALFLGVVGGFLALFFASAIALQYVIPKPGSANVSAIPQAWMDPVFAAE
jgi:ABC-type thiamin/hydroxymethylpyrimidine transport system permease subunit